MPSAKVCPQCQHVFGVEAARAAEPVRCPRCGALVPALLAAAAAPAPGGTTTPLVTKVIDKRYEVRGDVGSGSFGVVHLAWDRKQQREVAVKVLQDHVFDDPEHVGRFLREAKVLCDITHPNVVPVLNYGLDGKHYYIVFPLIRGQPLKDLIPSKGFADPTRAVRLIVTLAKALHYVFKERGILHRDVKPANVMVVEGDALYLMDFGLAACQDRSHATIDGTVMGTIPYMSPEQASGKIGLIGHASDVYGAAAVLYHMLTGTVPYPNENSYAMLLAINDRNIRPARPSSLRPGLDSALDAMVLKGLAKEVHDRYRTGQEFAQALQQWLDRGLGKAGAPAAGKPGRPAAPRAKAPEPARAALRVKAVKAPRPKPDFNTKASVSAPEVPTLVADVNPLPPGVQVYGMAEQAGSIPPVAGLPGTNPLSAGAAADSLGTVLGGLFWLSVLAVSWLLWLATTVGWAFWSFSIFFPKAVDIRRQGAGWGETPVQSTMPKMWAYGAGGVLLLWLVVLVGISVWRLTSRRRAC